MSDNKVILNYDGKAFEYPIIESTIGDRGIDISKLRDQTGLITLDLGYKNTGATLSDITYLDGDNGELYYRGYPIELAEPSFGCLIAIISVYIETIFIVSARVSPFEAELEFGSEKPSIFPPSLIIAASKLNLVLVLGS